jgi:hypothetical protein
MCLYDWIRLCKRVQLSSGKNFLINQKSSNNIFDSCNNNRKKPVTVRFTLQHPLYDTHGLEVYPPKTDNILKFLGPNLPRKDGTDRELYCCTMLTLFKPWHSGFDLKKYKQSWHEAFFNYQFSNFQNQIMENFHIRYECLNASDDYHTQMKKNVNKSVLLGMFNDNDDNNTDINKMENELVEEFPELVEELSTAECRHRKDAENVHVMLSALHWSEVNN